MADEARGTMTRTVETDLVVTSELNADSLAAREEARERVRAGLARASPRDFVVVQAKLLAEVSRPAFAETAFYSLPRKKKDPTTGKMVEIAIEGLSIRFAETAGRVMRNLMVQARVVAETKNERLVEVEVMDLEANFTEIVQGIVQKTEERRGFLKKGAKHGSSSPDDYEPPANAGEVVGRRVNSYGYQMFVCRVAEEQMLIKTNSLAARLRRNKILEMLPADIKESCLETARNVKQAAAEKDLREDAVGTRKKMFAAFAQINVTEPELRAYIAARWKVPVERLGASQLNELRSLRTAINDGRITFAAALAEEVDENAAAVDVRAGGVVTAPDLTPKPTEPAPPPKPAEDAEFKPNTDALRAADEAAKTAPPPNASPPRPAEPDSPPSGTLEFGAWLRERMLAADNGRRLLALSKRIWEAPADERKSLTEIYMKHAKRGEK